MGAYGGSAAKRHYIAEMITTLVLQMCLYFSSVYLVFFSIFEFVVYIFKFTTLPYSVGTLSSELILLLLLIAVEYMRIELGKRGNLTNQTAPLVVSLLLLLPSVLGCLYRYSI